MIAPGLRRAGYIIGLIAVALLIVGFGIRTYVYHQIFKTPAAPHFSAPRNVADSRLQDLAYLKDNLGDIDRSFSKAHWDEFEKSVADLSSRASSLSDAQFEMGIAKAVALARNGHTNLRAFGWGLTLNSIPLRFGWFAEGLFVVEVDQRNADLLGARVESEGDRTPEFLAEVFHAYVGGRVTLSHELSPHFLESPAALYTAGLIPSPSSVTFRFVTRDGKSVERAIAAEAVPVTGPVPNGLSGRDLREHHWPRRDLSPIPVADDTHAWVHVLDGLKHVPISLSNPDRLYWKKYLGDSKILFVQFNATVNDSGGPPLKEFLEETLQSVAQSRPRYIIIDLRSNSGGDYELTTEFTRELPKSIPANGKLFLLTSGNTFSAGIVMAARLKYFAGDRGVLLGQPMGDFERFWAEGSSRIILPNSHLMLSYATGYHDWASGCSIAQLFICAPENYFYGVPAGSLSPQIPVSWLVSDYLRGDDTAIDHILDVIGEPRSLAYVPAPVPMPPSAAPAGSSRGGT